MTIVLEKLIPACVTYDPAQLKTLTDAAYILQHEIDLYDEDQDGCLTFAECSRVRAALKSVKYIARKLDDI